MIAGGSRPVIYATFKAILDPGEKVLYAVPSWNNNHYAFLSGARPVEMIVGPESGFLPTAAAIAPLLPGVRLICANSPLNPCGTVMARDEVRALGELVVAENRRRAAAGERPVFIMWDQVYWMLTFGEARHYTPPGLVPEAAAWTIFVDGISKAFAATGLRVGWAVAPPYVTARMRDILGHIGAWAPRPEQVATARFLADDAAMKTFHETMILGLRERLDLLHGGFQEMARAGLPVASLAPQGAIYLSVRFDLAGRSHGGSPLRTNEEIRRLLLEEAGFAVVPFQAFGLREETGWMRLSVGAASPSGIREGLARVRGLLTAIS
jgi:aspartate aminotransferase